MPRGWISVSDGENRVGSRGRGSLQWATNRIGENKTPAGMRLAKPMACRAHPCLPFCFRRDKISGASSGKYKVFTRRKWRGTPFLLLELQGPEAPGDGRAYV